MPPDRSIAGYGLKDGYQSDNRMNDEGGKNEGTVTKDESFCISMDFNGLK